MRICNLEEKKISLGEKIFVFSEAGQREIAKEDLETIPAEDRKEAMEIYEKLRQNDGVINLEKKPTDKMSLIEESHRKAKVEAEEKPIILTDEIIGRNFKRLPKDRREDVLRMSVKAKDIQTKQKIVARENRPSNVTPIANLSKKSWKNLPQIGREAVLQKICSLQQELVKN